MILPAAAAGALPLAYLIPSVRGRFDAPLSPRLLSAFLLSAAVMAAHKAESYWSGEFDQCPVYLASGRADWAKNTRQAIFLSFVPTFLGMLLFACLALVGPPWHLLILTVWLAQGLHELHHSSKTAARGRLYPGTLTSILFVATVGLGVFPAWHDEVFGAVRDGSFWAYYAVMPCVWTAFYLEDKRWLRLAEAEVGSGDRVLRPIST